MYTYIYIYTYIHIFPIYNTYKMDKINLAIREHFSFNQLKNTQNVIDWFNEIPNEIDRYILKSIIIYIYIYICIISPRLVGSLLT